MQSLCQVTNLNEDISAHCGNTAPSYDLSTKLRPIAGLPQFKNSITLLLLLLLLYPVKINWIFSVQYN